MPVYKVKTREGVGYRWGTTGKIYYGPDAKQKALAQGQAIYAAGYKKK